MQVKIAKRYIACAASIILLWITVVAASGAGINLFPYHWNFQNTAEFGDSFGSLSGIMASIAALAAVATYGITREEIQASRSRVEVEHRRQQALDERLRQRDEAEDRRLLKAEFERTFFQLVQTFNGIVASTDIVSQNKQHPQVGRDAFKAMLSNFTRYSQTLSHERAFRRIFDLYSNDLSHYFRFLYHVILFVDHVENIDRYFYVRILRAGLSEAEIALIAMNCMFGEGREKFKPLVEKYAILHNISPQWQDALRMESHFQKNAFGRNG